MSSWLFVPIQQDNLEDPKGRKDTRSGELKSHATRVAHARIKQKRLKALQGSLVRFPLQKAPITDDSPTKEPSRLQARRPLYSDQSIDNNGGDILPFDPLLQTILGQGKPEPFCSDHLRELPPIAQDCLEYAYEVLWPTNAPALQGDVLRATINRWRTAGLQSPLEFYSQVSNAATLCLAKSTDPASMRKLSSIRILYQAKAIHLIQEALNELQGPPPITLITCIMNVHGQGAQMYESIAHQPIPESPLFKGFNLKDYGRFAPPRVHFPTLIMFIRQRGGLISLPPGLADPLQL